MVLKASSPCPNRTVVPTLVWTCARGSRRAISCIARHPICLYTALTTLDALPDLVQASLGGTFLAYLLLAVASNHVVFEAMNKGREPTPAPARPPGEVPEGAEASDGDNEADSRERRPIGRDESM